MWICFSLMKWFEQTRSQKEELLFHKYSSKLAWIVMFLVHCSSGKIGSKNKECLKKYQLKASGCMLHNIFYFFSWVSSKFWYIALMETRVVIKMSQEFVLNNLTWTFIFNFLLLNSETFSCCSFQAINLETRWLFWAKADQQKMPLNSCSFYLNLKNILIW